MILPTDSRGHSGTVWTDTTWRVLTSTSDFRVKILVYPYVQIDCTKLGERTGSCEPRESALSSLDIRLPSL